MKIYVRYAFFQTLKIFFIALLMATLLFALIFVVEGSVKRDFPLSLTLKMIPYLLPDALSKTLPIASLIAVTLFFSQMANNNEIIAIKAIGIAPWRILFPIWIFMIFVSLSSVWLNDLSLSWSRRQMATAALDSFETTLLEKLRADGVFAAPRRKFVVEVSRVEPDGTLINPSFSGWGGSFSGVAEKAHIEIDTEKDAVKANFENTEILTDKGGALLPKDYKLPMIPLEEIYDVGYRVDPPASKIAEAIAELDAQKENYRRRLATQAAFAFLRGNLDETTRPEWRNRADIENNIERKRNRYRLTIPRVWAAGFSCFFFAWVGAPFAIWFNKADHMSTIFTCFAPIALLYYPLLIFGLDGAKNGAVPPEAVWLGNVLFGFIGFYFLKKIH